MAAKAKSEGVMWMVRDLLAIRQPRTHDLIFIEEYKTGPEEVIKPVTFPPRDYVELPMHTAMRLVGNDGFEVRNEENQVIRPIVQEGKDGAQVKLKPGEVVARLDELDMGALRTRARAMPGGESFVNMRTKKEALCSFILGGGNGPLGGGFVAEDEVDEDAEIELEDED